MLQPYWIKSRGRLPGPVAAFGAGITERSVQDAAALFRLAFGEDHEVQSIMPIMNMREIEQNHVALNMGNALRRGIWFPLGFDHVSN